jgi:AcrR family transcriptional regulator
MQKQSSFERGRGVLDPTVPVDIGALSQRRRIVEAMVEICAEKTFAATTIADIVSRASVSRTTFYKHFADKRTCFDAALDVCIEELEGVAERAHEATDSPAETTRKSLAAILDVLATNPALAQLALAESVTVDSAVVERYRKLTIPALEQLWTQTGEPLRTYSDARVALDRVQVLIFNQLSCGRVKQLPDLLPEIVYIVVLPFAGHAEALRQARLVAKGQPPSGGAADGGNGR